MAARIRETLVVGDSVRESCDDWRRGLRPQLPDCFCDDNATEDRRCRYQRETRPPTSRRRHALLARRERRLRHQELRDADVRYAFAAVLLETSMQQQANVLRQFGW